MKYSLLFPGEDEEEGDAHSVLHLIVVFRKPDDSEWESGSKRPGGAAADDGFDDEPAVATAPVEAKPTSQKAEDILAMIRSRQKQ